VQIPPVLFLAAISEALPLLAGARHGLRLDPARRWIVLWSLILVTTAAIALPLALSGRNNLWVGYLFTPLEASAALIGLSFWHGNTIVRTMIRMAVPILIVISLGLMVFVEDTKNFSHIAAPLAALLVLSASVLTILLRIRSEEGSLLRSEWFWVCIGLALRYGGAVALDPLSSILVQTFPDLVISAWKIRSLIVVVASLVIAWGILCPIRPPRPSSGPLSPASLPSPSSLPRSARPS